MNTIPYFASRFADAHLPLSLAEDDKFDSRTVPAYRLGFKVGLIFARCKLQSHYDYKLLCSIVAYHQIYKLSEALGAFSSAVHTQKAVVKKAQKEFLKKQNFEANSPYIQQSIVLAHCSKITNGLLLAIDRIVQNYQQTLSGDFYMSDRVVDCLVPDWKAASQHSKDPAYLDGEHAAYALCRNILLTHFIQHPKRTCIEQVLSVPFEALQTKLNGQKLQDTLDNDGALILDVIEHSCSIQQLSSMCQSNFNVDKALYNTLENFECPFSHKPIALD